MPRARLTPSRWPGPTTSRRWSAPRCTGTSTTTWAQLTGLLDLPLCTTLELVEPPLPGLPFRCADEVIGLALADSPEIREAQHTIAKARAAVAAGKLDYVPSIAAVGGYANQSAADYV